jgi:hypothetical protein
VNAKVAKADAAAAAAEAVAGVHVAPDAAASGHRPSAYRHRSMVNSDTWFTPSSTECMVPAPVSWILPSRPPLPRCRGLFFKWVTTIRCLWQNVHLCGLNCILTWVVQYRTTNTGGAFFAATQLPRCISFQLERLELTLATVLTIDVCH